MKKNGITEYFEEVETEKEHKGYFYSVQEAITIAILGSLCGLRNVSQIQQWAASDRVSGFLKEKFGIERIPCYYWLLSLLKIVKPESLNKCFTAWVRTLLPEDLEGNTISLDGKTICSTGRMDSYESPLHIISAQLAEYGMTLGQRSVDGKSSEIPAVQALLRELEIQGCMIVADALNCQEETAKAVIEGKGDYLLSVKDNQPNTKNEIEEYVQDRDLRKNMGKAVRREKNRDRVEKRTAYVENDITWMQSRGKWANLACIGAIHTEFDTKKGKTSEWHYYISSRTLTAGELLRHARMEWSVESMHWLLDVHFREDDCRVEDRNVEQNLNILRKLALNLVRQYKANHAPKRPLSKIMFDCLLDCAALNKVISEN